MAVQNFSGIQPLYQTGSQPGGAPLKGQGAYGMVPNLPAYTTDTQQTVGTDIFSQLLANLPNYQQMTAQSSGNIGANLRGEVSPDVLNLLGQRAAERGIATGSPGSPNSNAAYMRALGLTSMGLQQLGEGQLTSAIQRTPIQQNQISTATTDLGAARAQYAAAPDPAKAAGAALAAARAGTKAGGSSVSMPGGGGATPYGEAKKMGFGTTAIGPSAMFGAAKTTEQLPWWASNWNDVSAANDSSAANMSWSGITPYSDESGTVPGDTYYNNTLDQSIYQPFQTDWYQQQAPEGTSYNAATDQSTYSPGTFSWYD